jgi:hypothetical protein
MARPQLRTLGKFAVLLAGPLIWSAHLTLVYAAASLEITLARQAGLPSRPFIALATLACLARIGWIGWSVRKDQLPRWEAPQQDLIGLWRKVVLFLCALSFVAVLWQGLPAILVPVETVSHASPP